ncbi:calcium-binding protein [Phaeobacter sp.]|uniref:calcium-binding protein n=1 Tax=Phaeobacter sp. TaxID=1902409 RepID=UPI0025D88757|nr:calcium-binding protein [Phaeobacter sp.]
MPVGSYDDFRGALLAFESGWDRERYDAGQIVDAQLTQWAGGSVGTFFPGYSNWGQLDDQQWEAMAYRSMNSLGFVGYQFGEALLIDLGYYQDDFYYIGGDTRNRWDGVWTGKNGVNSLDDFMTKEVQETAINEAFGYNLTLLEYFLGQAGRSLDEFVGQTVTYTDVDGSATQVTLSITGMLAAAHLRGASGLADLLVGNQASTDEYGTSILNYVQKFGGYDHPDVAALIAFWEDRRDGGTAELDTGSETPGSETPDSETPGDETPGDEKPEGQDPDPDPDPDKDPGKDPKDKPDSWPDKEPDKEPGSKPDNKPDNKPGEKPDAKPVEKPAIDGEHLVGSMTRDQLMGTGADDLIAGRGGNDRLAGRAGDDELRGGMGRDKLTGQRGEDELRGNQGADTIRGGNGNDTLYGGAGKDKLFGQRGEDDLYGGGGADCFVFAANHGSAVIRDFQLGVDCITILNGADDISDLTFDTVGADVVMSFANVSVTINNVTVDQLLGEDHFTF